MAVGHHVKFLKALNFMFYVEEVWRIEANHHAKFSRNWSIHSTDIAIFRIFKMATTANFDF